MGGIGDGVSLCSTVNTIETSRNTASERDVYEPYVGAISGATQGQAAASPIADEHHFTFSEKVSHLEVSTNTNKNLVPNVFFADDYTLVVSIPVGTEIGDGFNTKIYIGESR